MTLKIVTKLIILGLLTGTLSCTSPNANNDNNQASLYQSLGEKPAINRIIDNLITLIGQDEVVFAHFAESNVSHFKEKLTLFLCHLADGPCEYQGDTMQDIHRGMSITENQFNHFVELFISAMDAANISYPIQNQLLARLAPLRKSIIKI